MSSKQKNEPSHESVHKLNVNKGKNREIFTEIGSTSPKLLNTEEDKQQLLHQQQQQQQLLALQYLQHVFRQHQLNLLLLQQQQQTLSEPNAILTSPIPPTVLETKVNETNLSTSNDVSVKSSPTNTLPTSEDNHFCEHLQMNTINLTSATNGFFNRKRGRPPKNRFVEVYENTKQTPQAIFTSFKLEKHRLNAAGAARPSFHTICSGKMSHAVGTRQTNRTDSLVQMRNTSLIDQFDGKNDNDSNMLALNMILKQTERPNEVGSNVEQIVRNSKKRITQLPKRFVPYEPAEKYEGNSEVIVGDSTKQNSNDEISSILAENISVVRAAGTFYPENCESTITSVKDNVSKLKEQKFSKRFEIKRQLQTFKNDSSSDDDANRPQDLTINRLNDNDDKITNEKQQMEFQQIFRFYQENQKSTRSQTKSVNSDNTRMPSKVKLLPTNQRIPDSEENLSDLPALLNPSTSTMISSLGRFRRNGYMKYRYNEKCGYADCAYSLHQSHFHCTRLECNYSFCDRTRMAQHTARHDRLDQLMGEDFQQSRNNSHCGYTNCIFSKRNKEVPATNTISNNSIHAKKFHYHCRKCAYVCCETNKILTHRRHHSKLEHIQSAGFRKVSGHEDCLVNGGLIEICPYRMKNTHYHCLECGSSVLARAQLNTHKHKSLPKMETEKFH